MSWFTIGWFCWFGAFLVLEGTALFNRREGDTLSEHVWRWWHVLDPRPTRLVWAARVPLALFLVWLTLHLTFGWFTPTRPWPGA